MNPKYLLQIGLAFTLLFASIDSFIHPDNWIGFIPQWVDLFGISAENALRVHGVGNMLLGAGLLTNKLLKPAAWLTTVLLLGIILTNGFGSLFLTTFRDIGLFFVALYLATSTRHQGEARPLTSRSLKD